MNHEYKYGNVTVRIHGTPRKEELEAACKEYMQKVERGKKNV